MAARPFSTGGITTFGVPGVFIVKRYRLFYVDNRCQAITGYSHEELLNRDVREVLHPAFREMPSLEAVERSPGRGSQPYESKLVTKSGQERWVAGELSRIASDGQRAILGTVFDVTPRKRAEEYARTGSSVVQQIFDQAPLGMALVGPDFRLLRVNSALCRMLGYTADELVGRTVSAMVHPEDVPATLASAEALVSGRTGQINAERRYRRKNGMDLWLGITAGPLRDADSAPICGLAMFEDISYRKRVEARERRYSQMLLSRIEEERCRIARELHDDIGQSLALVGLQMRGIAREVAGERRIREGLREVTRRVEDTARAVAGLAHTYHPADLRNLGLSAALRTFAHQWACRQSLAVSADVEPLSGLLSVDQELHVYRIVQEAFNNIAKHANARSVRLRARHRGAVVLVVIKDDGAGFDSANLAAADKGLGLATMEERARMAGGELAVCRDPSGGCRVSLVIPLR